MKLLFKMFWQLVEIWHLKRLKRFEERLLKAEWKYDQFCRSAKLREHGDPYERHS